MNPIVVNSPRLREPSGYSNGILAQGRWLFAAGQVGWDASGKFATGLVEQFDQALANVLEVVAAAGGKPESICRLTIYLLDKRDYAVQVRAIGQRYRERMGRHYPAMTLVEVKSLLEDQALIELEATACLP